MTVIKFIYKDQIRSAPELLASLDAVRAFLKETFGPILPANYILKYNNPNSEAFVLINEEDYQRLRSENFENEVTVHIEALGEATLDQVPIGQLNIGQAPINRDVRYPSLSGYQQPQNFDIDALNNQRNQINERYKNINRQFAEYLADVHTIPELQINPEQRERVTSLIQQRLNELMPDIITASNRAVLKDKEATAGRPEGAKRASVLDHSAEFFSKNLPVYAEKGAGFAKLATSFIQKNVDTMAKRLGGDPYITTGDGRYPKSVITKFDQLKPLLPNESNKDLLDYINESPKETTIEVLVNYYPTYKQMKAFKEAQGQPLSQ